MSAVSLTPGGHLISNMISSEVSRYKEFEISKDTCITCSKGFKVIVSKG